MKHDKAFIENNIETFKKENPKYKVISKYPFKINYNSGMTAHYKDIRIHRERVLNNLVGLGEPVIAFVVKDENGELQIQEVLDNGVINVYSFYTHKKITIFAPHPNRIMLLYESIGAIPPEYLITRSEENAKKGYNEIYLWKRAYALFSLIAFSIAPGL